MSRTTFQTAPVCKRNPARKEVKLRTRRISITTRCPGLNTVDHECMMNAWKMFKKKICENHFKMHENNECIMRIAGQVYGSTFSSFSKSNSNEAIEALGSLGHPERTAGQCENEISDLSVLKKRDLVLRC